MNKRQYLLWLAPLLFILLLAPLSTQIDLSITRYFYSHGEFQSNNFLNFMYQFGFVPGWLLAIIAGIFLFLSYLSPFWKNWRPFVLIPLLTLAFGAGLIVHAALKDHWGRPRPKQIEEFGGQQAFRPFYKPNFFSQTEPSKSFPSGHSSMGFLFFSLAIVGQRLRQRWLVWIGIGTSLILGGLLGYTRIAQGGHFFTDIILSAAIMWWTALFFDWLIFHPRKINETSDKKAI